MGEGCSRKALLKLLLYCPEGYTSGFLLSAFAPESFLTVGVSVDNPDKLFKKHQRSFLSSLRVGVSHNVWNIANARGGFSYAF